MESNKIYAALDEIRSEIRTSKTSLEAIAVTDLPLTKERDKRMAEIKLNFTIQFLDIVYAEMKQILQLFPSETIEEQLLRENPQGYLRRELTIIYNLADLLLKTSDEYSRQKLLDNFFEKDIKLIPNEIKSEKIMRKAFDYLTKANIKGLNTNAGEKIIIELKTLLSIRFDTPTRS